MVLWYALAPSLQTLETSSVSVIHSSSCWLPSHMHQSVQSLSHVRLCHPMDCSMPGFPVHHQLLELAQTHVSIESVMPSRHLILCHPRLFLPSILPRIRVFSNKLVLCIWWPKNWSFSISPSNEYSGLISFWMDWLEFLAVQWTLKTTNYLVLSFLYSSTLTSIHDYLKRHNIY